MLPDEARTARPLLRVNLIDEREDQHMPLPTFQITDPRIILTSPSSPAHP